MPQVRYGGRKGAVGPSRRELPGTPCFRPGVTVGPRGGARGRKGSAQEPGTGRRGPLAGPEGQGRAVVDPPPTAQSSVEDPGKGCLSKQGWWVAEESPVGTGDGPGVARASPLGSPLPWVSAASRTGPLVVPPRPAPVGLPVVRGWASPPLPSDRDVRVKTTGNETDPRQCVESRFGVEK